MYRKMIIQCVCPIEEKKIYILHVKTVTLKKRLMLLLAPHQASYFCDHFPALLCPSNLSRPHTGLLPDGPNRTRGAQSKLKCSSFKRASHQLTLGPIVRHRSMCAHKTRATNVRTFQLLFIYH